jgi:hypothetical protein
VSHYVLVTREPHYHLRYVGGIQERVDSTELDAFCFALQYFRMCKALAKQDARLQN